MIRRIRSTFLPLAAVVGIAISIFHSGAYAREITNPDDVQIDLLYRFLASDPPDFSSEAKKRYEVRSANEFNRQNIARQIEEGLRRDFELMQDVDVVRIRARAKLSEYDSERGGFYVSALSPGSYFKYGKVQLSFENADQFHFWEVPVGNAREIVEQIGYSREIIADIKMRPFAVDAVRGKRLRTQVIGLDILSRKTNQQFAALTIPKDQYRKIEIAGLQSETALSPDQLNILGLTHNMRFDQVVDWAVNGGFAMFSFADKGSEPHIGADGGKAIKDMIAAENKPGKGLFAVKNPSYYPKLYISSDRRSFQIQLVKGGWGGAREFVEGDRYSIFGSKFDCLSPQNLGAKCGLVEFWGSDADDDVPPDSVKRITFVQNASGITREQIVAKLTEKYGPPSDNISTDVHDQYRSNLLIWGRSRQNSGNESQMYFSRVAWTQTWEVEAYIVEPEGNRIAVVTIINVIPEDADNTAASSGQVSF